MIETALDLLVADLNAYVNGPEGEPFVLLERLVDDEGKYLVGQGKVACTLVNLEEERITNHKFRNNSSGDFHAQKNPELLFNLYVLFAVNPKTNQGSYGEGLRLLSRIVAFFQGKPLFNHQNTPSMSADLDELMVEMFPMSIEHQNNLWASLGAKYLPSALYKVRMVAISDSGRFELEPLIQTLNISEEMQS